MFNTCPTGINRSVPSLLLTQPLLQKSVQPLQRSNLVESPNKAGGCLTELCRKRLTSCASIFNKAYVISLNFSVSILC